MAGTGKRCDGVMDRSMMVMVMDDEVMVSATVMMMVIAIVR